MRQSKAIFALIILVFISSVSISNASFEPPEITAPSGILIDASTGDILYEKNSHELMYPASTTKTMTAILALENANLEDKVVIDKETPFTDGSRIYVIEDEILTIEQLLYALMVESANDAAVALAKHVSGNVEEFAKLMNKRAKELGALNTNFVNPNGLPNEEHVTTAYDLAMIARHGMTIPKFVELTNTVRYQIPPTNKQVETRYFKNSNRFLWAVGGNNRILYKGEWIDIKCDYIKGIKTGYTMDAQQCLISSALKDSHRFISVVLKAKGTNIYLDTRTLIDYGLENYNFREVAKGNKIITTASVEGGIKKEIALATQKSLVKAIPNNVQNKPIKSEMVLTEQIKAPIEKNDVLGKIIYTVDGEILGEVNLIAADSVPVKKSLTAVYYLEKSSSSKFMIIFAVFLALFLLWRGVVTAIKINKRNKLIMFKKRKERDIIRQITLEKISEVYKRK